MSFQMVLLMGECRGMRFAEPSFKTLPESMHHSVLPSSHRMTDRHSPAGTALPGSAVFSARAPQIKQRKAAAAKQDAGQQQDRPEAGRHKIAFQACMQGAIPVHETDRMQAGEYPQGRQPA